MDFFGPLISWYGLCEFTGTANKLHRQAILKGDFRKNIEDFIPSVELAHYIFFNDPSDGDRGLHARGEFEVKI